MEVLGACRNKSRTVAMQSAQFCTTGLKHADRRLVLYTAVSVILIQAQNVEVF